jgi:hypothetical protein
LAGLILIIVTASKEEVIRAAFGAEMTACEKITAIFTDFIEADWAFIHPALFF